MKRLFFILCLCLSVIYSTRAEIQTLTPATLKKARDLYYQGYVIENMSNVDASWMLKVSRYYREAAELGYSPAQRALGYLYEIGCTEDANYKSDTIHAEYWYGKSDNIQNLNGYYGEMDQFSITNNSDFQKVLLVYELAKKGDGYYQLYLGNCFYNGTFVQKSYAQALKWWRRAAENGEKEHAWHNMGLIYWEVSTLYWDFCTHLDDSVLNDPWYGRGHYSYNCNKKRRDYAFPYLIKAADLGNSDAQYLYGRTLYKYSFQLGTTPVSDNKENKKNEQKGVYYLKLAADQENINALNLLLEISNEHKDEYLSPQEELHYAQMATEQYSEQYENRPLMGIAHYLIGNYYEYGNDTTPPNLEIAIEHFEKAAEMGHYNASLHLMRIYRSGKGDIKKDRKKAHYWRRVAQKNDKEMGVNLGIIFLYSICLIVSVCIFKRGKYTKSNIRKLECNVSLIIVIIIGIIEILPLLIRILCI